MEKQISRLEVDIIVLVQNHTLNAHVEPKRGSRSPQQKTSSKNKSWASPCLVNTIISREEELKVGNS
jgi:hypothetical protein